MRTTTKIPHPVLDINIYLRENTYVIKLVLNQYEQVYRIKQIDVNELSDVEKMLTNEFLDKVYMRFVEMSKDFKKSFNTINTIDHE